MRLLLVVGGALFFGAIVWLAVAAQAVDLWNEAGWYALATLAWPAFIGFGVWRGWGD